MAPSGISEFFNVEGHLKTQQSHATIKAQALQAHSGFRADRALCALLGKLNRRAAKTLFHEGLVRLNGVVASGSERVKAGDTLEFPDPGSSPSENLIEKAKAPRLTTPHGRHLVRLYEDNDVLVISKPAEIPVYRGQDGFSRRDTLEDVLVRAYPPKKIPAYALPKKTEGSGPVRHAKRVDEEDEDSAPTVESAEVSALQPGFYFVHRLDMETSGCLLIAKNHEAYEALTREFRERTIHKEYLAIVAGAVSWDEVVSTRPIKYVRGVAEKKYDDGGAREPKRGNSPFYSLMRKQRSEAHHAAPKLGQKKGIALEEGSEEGKPCETQFIALERYRGYSMVRCEPRTGRTHQIRVHLAALGHPLAYDPFYGKKSPYRLRDFDPSVGPAEHGDEVVLNRLPLHAWRLGFTHPRTGKKIFIEAPPPRDFKEFARLLKKFRSFGNR